MRIEHATASYYRVPLKEPWFDANHPVTHIELVVVDVETDVGVTGTGFSATCGVGGKAVQAMLEWELLPTLAGVDVKPRTMWHDLWMQVHDAGGAGVTTIAIGAIDIAAWDALAKEARLPLVDYLGRVRSRVAAYKCGINLHLGSDELKEQLNSWKAAGYRAFKVKVGREDLAEDVERIRAAREVAEDSLLMIDVNQGWDVSSATRALRALAPFNVHWIEEPLISDDIGGHAELRRRVATPIAMGENVFNRYQFRDYIASRAVDYVQADVVRVGGVTAFLELASMADSWDLPIVPSFMMELGGQMMCCVRNGNIIEDVEGGSFSELGILEEAIAVKGGFFEPSAIAGHGIRFDRATLACYAVGDDAPNRIAKGQR